MASRATEATAPVGQCPQAQGAVARPADRDGLGPREPRAPDRRSRSRVPCRLVAAEARAEAFEIERAPVRDGVTIGYVRAGIGGYPLLLLHGWPETKRIWWRNIGPLAEAGFEVIVPDLRGFGDSGLAPDGFYDLAAHARDMHALVADMLGHERCAAAGICRPPRTRRAAPAVRC